MPESVTIVGAGLAGSLLACMLAERGHRVTVHERRPDPRARGFIGGRSINLALSERGLAGLRTVGLADRVLADAIPMPARIMHGRDGTLTRQPYSADASDAINSVSRSKLNLTLLDAAEERGADLRFDARCLDVDLEAGQATFAGPDGEQRSDGSVLIGADGAFSAVRGAMQRTDRFDYQQSYLAHGYKELEIPPTAAGEFALDPHGLHIWPRGGYMMIALPNQDRTFTCTLFCPFDGPNGLGPDRTDDEVVAWMTERFGDAVPLMPKLLEHWRANPVSSLATVRCAPWHVGRCLLIGDAAHAIVPFYGQGINAGFEDCRLLVERLDHRDGNWMQAFSEFSTARKPDADAIADLALHNFIEMRDKVGSAWFLWGKKLEKLLHRLFPTRFVPLYNMVSFTSVPYAEACRRAARQWHVVAWVAGTAALLLVVLLALLVLSLIR